MRAVLCSEFGPPETLAVKEVAAPTVGERQVKIDVHAAGLNFPDTLMIAGRYQTKTVFPFCPGLEVAGVVTAVGPGVASLDIGQRVMARTGGQGGFAEQAVVDEELAYRMPDAMSFDAAAGFLVTYGTAYHALVDRGRLAAGEWLLVHGGGSGVGLCAVEVGKALGARVIATASSAEKLAAAAASGADEGINYRELPQFRDRVKAITKSDGADVIFDPVGGDVFDESLRCINWGGRLLVVGFATGRIPTCNVNMVLLKGCDLVGVFMGAFSKREPQKTRSNFNTLLGMVGEGKLKPLVSKTYPLAEVPQAMNALLARQATGKIVIRVKE